MNADKAIPTVELEFDGKKHQVACTFYVLCQYQRASGKNPFGADFLSTVSPADIVLIFQAALKQNGVEAEIEAIERGLSGKQVGQITRMIGEMMKLASPEIEEELEGEPKPEVTKNTAN